MTMLASQITSLTVVYSIFYSGVNQRKHQSSASLAFVREIHRGPVNFPHKWPVTRKMFPFDDVIMLRNAWWRHQMETVSALLAICAGNSPVPGEFPAQRPVTRAFDVIFDLRLNKRLSKQSWGWWFETLSCSLWRHRNDAHRLEWHRRGVLFLSRSPVNFQFHTGQKLLISIRIERFQIVAPVWTQQLPWNEAQSLK